MVAVPMVEARVIWKEHELEARLRELGLAADVIIRAVAVGHTEASNCTDHDPVTLSGSVRWGRSTRSLRDDLVPAGWTRSSDDGIETVVHPNRKFAIAVVRGNEQTGVVGDEPPKTKYSRGPAVHNRVLRNRQLSLFDEMPPQLVRAPLGMPTYFLMQYPTKEYVAFELCLPAACDDSDRFSAYVERLVFEPYFRNGEPSKKKDIEQPVDIDVVVTRRE